MLKQCLLMSIAVLFTGCGPTAVPEAPSRDQPKQPPQADLRIGDGQDEQPHLAFKIVTVYERQKPSADLPYHVN
jgi:hypothetical protein